MEIKDVNKEKILKALSDAGRIGMVCLDYLSICINEGFCWQLNQSYSPR